MLSPADLILPCAGKYHDIPMPPKQVHADIVRTFGSDLVVMADEAKIGYPPARVWGCPTTAMWVYRIGAEKAKRMLLTGDLVTGKEAAAMGLVLESVPGTWAWVVFNH